MQASIRDVSAATLGIVVAFFLFSCARFMGLPPKIDEHQIEAEQKLSVLVQSNAGLVSFKGIGRIQYIDNTRVQTVRAAWAGVVPDRIRIEALGASGQPVIRLAADGTWLYMNSFYPQRFYKTRSKKKLGKLLPIPITTDALIALLAGRAPAYDFHTLSLQPGRTENGPFFILRGRWGGVAQKIYPDPTGTRVVKVETFNPGGGLAYRAQMIDWKTVSGFSLPFGLRLFKNEQAVFGLTVERYWLNVPVEPSLFTLLPP